MKERVCSIVLLFLLLSLSYPFMSMVNYVKMFTSGPPIIEATQLGCLNFIRSIKDDENEK